MQEFEVVMLDVFDEFLNEHVPLRSTNLSNINNPFLIIFIVEENGRSEPFKSREPIDGFPLSHRLFIKVDGAPAGAAPETGDVAPE